mmetsp:Transcript_13604/g.43008  ORF Transcript_13604/g.43008 Transcript_13604/m.43008 type:complete len:279 (-) Transcript_13604:279-1115(-)
MRACKGRRFHEMQGANLVKAACGEPSQEQLNRGRARLGAVYVLGSPQEVLEGLEARRVGQPPVPLRVLVDAASHSPKRLAVAVLARRCGAAPSRHRMVLLDHARHGARRFGASSIQHKLEFCGTGVRCQARVPLWVLAEALSHGPRHVLEAGLALDGRVAIPQPVLMCLSSGRLSCGSRMVLRSAALGSLPAIDQPLRLGEELLVLPLHLGALRRRLLPPSSLGLAVSLGPRPQRQPRLLQPLLPALQLLPHSMLVHDSVIGELLHLVRGTAHPRAQG